MKFKTIAASVLSLSLLIGLDQMEVVHADTRDIESVNKDIFNIEKSIVENINRIDAINREVKNIEITIEQYDKEVNLKEIEIKNLNEEVDKLKTEINQLEKDIEARDEVIKKRLRAIQLSDGHESYIDVLLGAKDFKSFISGISAVNTLIKADGDLIKVQEEAIEEVEEKEKLINMKLEESKKAKDKLISMGEEIKVKKEELIANKTNLNSEKSTLEKKKESYIKEGNDIKRLEEITKIALESKRINDMKNEQVSIEQNNVKSNTSLETKSFNVNESSSPNTASKVLTMEATAYTADCAGCSGITKTGLNLKKNRHMKVVAVDPRVIPLGSRVWVEGYGEAIAGDIGGAIKGNKIDLHFPTKSSALQFGRKSVTVKVLN